MNIFESYGRSLVSEGSEEFKLETEDGWVHILDGEGSVRLSLPEHTFREMCKKFLNKTS